jgi:hypothetical protein
VGSAVPIDYYLIAGIIGVLVFIIEKVAGGFLEETGKIAAQKMLNKDDTRKELQKQMKIDKNEYNIISNQSIIIITKNSGEVDDLAKNLRKNKRNRKKAH